MRTLKFIVDGQSIRQDPACDFSNLVPGSKGYLQAEFKFSKEWAGTEKVAGFYSVMGREFPPQVINSSNICPIPDEALKGEKFKIRVFGLRGADFKLTTDKVTVCQNGGK